MNKANHIKDLESLYSPQQLAQYLDVSVRQAKRMLERKEIRHIRSGNKIFIPKSAIQEWLHGNQNSDDPEKGNN
jgi:excisionase family DNA binding protein